MGIEIDLDPTKHAWYLGLSFQWRSTIVSPPPGPYTVTFNLLGTTSERRVWNVIRTTTTLGFQTQILGQGLNQTVLQVDRTTQVKEGEQANMTIEVRADSGAVIENQVVSMPWTWQPTIGVGLGTVESYLKQVLAGQTAPTDQLDRIEAAVYKPWPDG